jgi:hypothetical protein
MVLPNRLKIQSILWLVFKANIAEIEIIGTLAKLMICSKLISNLADFQFHISRPRTYRLLQKSDMQIISKMWI